MDKRNKRYEATDKKYDSKDIDTDELKKTNEKIKRNANENMHVNMNVADRGDYKIFTNQKPEKMRLNILVKKPTHEDSKFKNKSDSAVEKELRLKKITDKDEQNKAQSEFELRKRIRDKYTLKFKNINKPVSSNTNLNKKDESKTVARKNSANKPADRPKKQMTEETTQTKDTNYPSALVKKDVKTESKSSPRRKPIIKTIMSKNGSVRIYKAVTFVDQRRTPHTHAHSLEINIPTVAFKKPKDSKLSDTSSLKIKTKTTVSRVSIKEKAVVVRKKTDRKRNRKLKHVVSPDISVKAMRSPPTEVARWAPSSIDRHTKPYYEAWVNTTLAAISKHSKKDKLYYEKHKDAILKSFKRAFEERPESPQLIYENFTDERYTGRIKIRHK